jgi:hypothetical protein
MLSETEGHFSHICFLSELPIQFKNSTEEGTNLMLQIIFVL